MVPDNVKRLVGSLVLAAVACLGCVGFAVVAGIVADRDAGAHPTPGSPAATSATDPSAPVPSGQAAGGSRP